MCEVSTVLMVASMVVTAAAGYHQADAAKKAGQAEVEMAARNQRNEEYRAEQSKQIGAVAEENHRAKVRQMLGTQNANLAAQGVDTTSGTAADLMAQTVQFGETDAETIRYNATMEAWGHQIGASNYAAQQAVTRASTKNAVRGTWLTTAGSLMSQGYGGYSSGAFSRSPKTTTTG